MTFPGQLFWLLCVIVGGGDVKEITATPMPSHARQMMGPSSPVLSISGWLNCAYSIKVISTVLPRQVQATGKGQGQLI